MANFVARALCAVILLYAPAHVAASELRMSERPHWSDERHMAAYRGALYADHVRCSELASRRLLSYREAKHCGRNYLALKLSFLNGVTFERYHAMTPVTRATANEKGYAAYRAWMHRIKFTTAGAD